MTQADTCIALFQAHGFIDWCDTHRARLLQAMVDDVQSHVIIGAHHWAPEVMHRRREYDMMPLGYVYVCQDGSLWIPDNHCW